MIALLAKGNDPKYTWEIVGIYRAQNEDIWFLEKLADRIGYMGGTTKLSFIGSGINIPYADWNGHAEIVTHNV
jgi:hypothetical protein